MASSDADRWPELPYAAWQETAQTLHLWTQVVGKVRLALTPWLNHSWHVALYLTERGLTTTPMPWRGGDVQIDFDFIDHVLWLRTGGGQVRQVMLRPMPVAEFYATVMATLRQLGVDVTIRTMPSEIPDAIPFDKDTVHEAYDPEYAPHFCRVLLSTHDVFARFRTGFLGKASPVHFFWSSFDLSVRPHCAEASGRRAASGQCGGAGGLFARGVERRLLAGGAGRRRCVLLLCLAGAAGFRRGARDAGGGSVVAGAGRVRAALRGHARGA
jgi:hypothetical protein